MFYVGETVKGNDFIGRKKLIKSYRENYLIDKIRSNVSIVGLTRLGKTSFIQEVFNTELPDDLLYIYISLGSCNNFMSIWSAIVHNIKRYIRRHPGYDYEYVNEAIDNFAKDMDWSDFMNFVSDLFIAIYDLEIRTILVLDEFDKATTLFTESHHYGIFRNLFSESFYHVSGILISRRRLHVIEGKDELGSTFHGVLRKENFKGFNDDDMKEYYAILEAKQGSELTNIQKERIHYYAGRYPYLLSMIGYSFEREDIYDIDEIYRLQAENINDYYEECKTHLKRDGFYTDILTLLYDTEHCDSKRMDNLISLGYLNENTNIIISEHFHTFLNASDSNMPLLESIHDFELKLKEILKHEEDAMKKVYNIKEEGNEGQKALLLKLPEFSEGSLKRTEGLRKKHSKNGKTADYFDAIVLSEKISIIQTLWDSLFKKYFRNEEYLHWGEKFDFIREIRNTAFHVNDEVLSDDEKNKCILYCDEIIKLSVEDVHDDAIPAVLIKEESIEELPEDLVGKEVDFVGNSINTTSHGTKNLRGLVENKYPGTILSGYLKNKDIDSLKGKTLKCTVLKIENGRYNLEYLNDESIVYSDESNTGNPFFDALKDLKF